MVADIGARLDVDLGKLKVYDKREKQSAMPCPVLHCSVHNLRRMSPQNVSWCAGQSGVP